MQKKVVRFLLLFLLGCSFCQAEEWGTREYAEEREQESQESTPYRILCFDGGGIRGAYSAQLLAMLEEELHFLDKVDLFVGTSTGAILASGLAYGLSPKDIVALYRTHAKEIFHPQGGIYGYLQMQAKYQRQCLHDAICSVIPEKVLLQDIQKKVVCVAFELHNPAYDSWTPALVDNFELSPTKKVKVVDAILRSAAAPIYFPSYQGYVDGGTVANNPSMMALARALDREGGHRKLKDIRLLSVGTGLTNNYIPEDVDWGAVEWMLRCPYPPPSPPNPLLEILFNGTISVPHFQCSQILGSRYYRLNAFLSEDLLLDDWQKVDFLIEEARKLPESAPEEWERLRQWVRERFLK